MPSEERANYIQFLKFLRRSMKDKKGASDLVDNLSEEGIQKICRCLWSVLYQPEVDTICFRKNKKNAQELSKLVHKNIRKLELLTKHSTKKQDINSKRKIIRGSGILGLLGLAIPSLLSLMSK